MSATRFFLAALALLALATTPVSASHGCTGAKNCKVCTNCKYCAYCSVKGHTCGVCAPVHGKKPVIKPQWRRKHPLRK